MATKATKRPREDPPGDDDEGTKCKKQFRRRTASSVDHAPQYFKPPSYVNCGAKCGGKLSEVILGPNGYLSVNTDAASNKPSGITEARKKYPKYAFKAGHLLNATFGGDGKDSKNLIILTASANVKCNKFDNLVKRAIEELRRLYELLCKNYVAISQIKFGIQVKVTVGVSTWGSDKVDRWIHKEFCMSAETVDSFDVESLKDSNGEKLELTDGVKKSIRDAVQQIDRTLAPCASMTIQNTKN